MMVSVALAVPRFWVNVIDWRLKLAIDCARLPVSGTDCDVPPAAVSPDAFPAASSTTVSMPVRVALSSEAIWLSVTVIWQLLCAAITLGQLLLWENSGLVPWSSPTDEMCSNPSPLLVRVTIAGAGGALAGWWITTAGGLRLTSEAVPRPVRVTSWAPPIASLGITTLPVWPPGARGWKATSKEQLVPGSSRAWTQEFFAGLR